MSVRHGRWFCVLAAALAGCAGSTVSDVIILPEALGVNISGVITTAILTGIFVSLVPHMH